MKTKNFLINFKNEMDGSIYLEGPITLSMDPLGFYVIKHEGKMYGFNSDEVDSYTYEVDEPSTTEDLGDNVHKLQ
jgi:hypothetical protein